MPSISRSCERPAGAILSDCVRREPVLPGVVAVSELAAVLEHQADVVGHRFTRPAGVGSLYDRDALPRTLPVRDLAE